MSELKTKATEPVKEKKALTMPHTYIIIFGVILVCWILTYIAPVGKYDTQTAKYILGGQEKSRSVLIPESFRYQYDIDNSKLKTKLQGLVSDQPMLDKYKLDKTKIEGFLSSNQTEWTKAKLKSIGLDEPVLYGIFKNEIYNTDVALKKPTGIWGTQDFYGFGVLNYLFEGLVSGDRSGSAVGIVAFILIIGGSFGIMIRTGAVEAGIMAMISRTRGREILIIPALFILFSLGGATFGMSEASIPFVLIIAPLTVAMGYDAVVAVCITFVATQIGQGSSWMNPFGVAIAQGIAGIPVLSGTPFRIVMWSLCTLVGIIFTLVYARRVKKNPLISVSYESDAFFRNEFEAKKDIKADFNLGHILVILTLIGGIVWIVWGVVWKNYFIPEISSQFFVMGLLSGIIGVLFKLNGMTINDVPRAFQNGAADLVGAAMVVGMAKGILLVLGGSNATDATVLNTVLHSVGNALKGFPVALTAWFMYVFQTIFNFFVTSGSGQAALTMPIMAPLSDIVGVPRQIAVLAYQLGAGFADAIVPTSASLMGVLAAARIDWVKWFKFQIKMQGVMFAVGTSFILVAVMINFS